MVVVLKERKSHGEQMRHSPLRGQGRPFGEDAVSVAVKPWDGRGRGDKVRLVQCGMVKVPEEVTGGNW